jgi:hypothetical protein
VEGTDFDGRHSKKLGSELQTAAAGVAREGWVHARKLGAERPKGGVLGPVSRGTELEGDVIAAAVDFAGCGEQIGDRLLGFLGFAEMEREQQRELALGVGAAGVRFDEPTRCGVTFAQMSRDTLRVTAGGGGT